MPVTNSFFQRIPFIRISSLFLIGILISHYLPIDFNWIGILLILMIAILILLWKNSHFTRVEDLLISLGLILSGVFFPNREIEQDLPTFDQKDYFLAEVCQKPEEKAKTYQSILWIQSRFRAQPLKAIAYFSKENFDTTLVPGDQLILLGKPLKIKNRGNPFEFDYQKMMHNKGVDFSIYLAPGTFKKTGIKIKRLSYFAERVRGKMLLLLSATGIEKEERSVISALTLGYREELDNETMDYFVNTGTIHVLSVSGLHVALIFFILGFLFSGINHWKFGNIIYPSLMILFLWIYAFITGFSPPVQRSTVMFSFVIIGQSIRRPVNIYNSLFASALVLILLNPNVLFDVGFQLSYLAIFGIVLLQPPLENLIQLKNKILKWAWTLFTVSMAAQLITFPLSILYFNQFPNLFWLSNYFVIPGTTLLIWLTFGFFVLSPIPLISGFLATIIQFITNLMLIVLKWMSELPHAVTHGIVFNALQTWIIYGFIAAFIIYGFSKKRSWLFGALILLIFFQSTVLWTKYGLFNQKAVYVYNSKNILLHLINGRENYILWKGPNSVSEQEMKMIQNVCNHLRLKNPKLIELTSRQNFNATDLKINDQSFNFLNCRIHFSNQLEFHIEGNDLIRFITANPELTRKNRMEATLLSDNWELANKKAFSINFTCKLKEPFILNLH